MAVLQGAQQRSSTFSPGNNLHWIGLNVRRPLFVLGVTHYHHVPSGQFDNFVSWAHYHILNAQIAGGESPGRTTCARQLSSLRLGRAKTALSVPSL